MQEVFRYPVLAPLAGLRTAILSAAPDLVVPCDDNAAVHLHRLHERTGAESAGSNALRAVIARSLGSPEACLLASTRGRLMALAQEEGVRTPASATIGTSGELELWLQRHGFPAVLKIDATWGGLGVAIVHDLAAARQAFSLMMSRPRIGTALSRLLLDRDSRSFLAALRRPARTVTVQRFIAGTPANRAVACWQGAVLAGISVEAICTQHQTGPATVVRPLRNPEMCATVNRLVRRLGISGLWGADFVLEESTGAAYLIEVNPRATPICHLSWGARRNLPAALLARLRDVPLQVMPAAIEQEVIAMFPGEWQRDASSSHLCAAFHDIPWEEPELVRDGMDRPWSERGLLARARARMRRQARREPA